MKKSSSFIQIVIHYILQLTTIQRRLGWLVMDLAAFVASSIIAYIAFIDIIRPVAYYYVIFTLLSFLIYAILTKVLGFSNHITRYLKLAGLFRLGCVVALSSILSGVICRLTMDVFPFRFMVLSALASAIIIVSYRMIWQLIYSSRHRYDIVDDKIKNVLLIGAGDGGSIFIDNYLREPSGKKVLGILDNDPKKIGTNISGIPVMGDITALTHLIPELEIQEVIVAIPSLPSEKYSEILELTNAFSVDVFRMPYVEEVVQGANHNKEVKKIEIADLLGRQEIVLDDSTIRTELEGKTILITGAGGSIGSEIARQVSNYNPKKIVLLGHGENSIYLINQELNKNIYKTSTQIVPVIADIKEYDRLLSVFQAEKPDIVYHAAAHKHVPLMEWNPIEAVTNNILGSYHVAKAVDAAKVPKMIMISTDKAINPTNVMGATKRIAELIVTGMNSQSKSIYAAVRFGNVLGSRGSVIPLFEKQIESGGPVTVTDFRMTRYFMTIPEASRLVIFAGAHAHGGEVFILNMGEPVKIYDLAKKMILLSGHTEKEIGIVESGIRPGEKLYEELITSDEYVDEPINENIYLGKVAEIPLSTILAFVDQLPTVDPKELKDVLIDFANNSHADASAVFSSKLNDE